MMKFTEIPTVPPVPTAVDPVESTPMSFPAITVLVAAFPKGDSIKPAARNHISFRSCTGIAAVTFRCECQDEESAEIAANPPNPSAWVQRLALTPMSFPAITLSFDPSKAIP